MRGWDLAYLLANEQIQSLLADWFDSRKDLQALGFLAADSELAEWAIAYGAAVLEIYARDKDKLLLRNAIQSLSTTGLPLHDTYDLLKTASEVPFSQLLTLIESHGVLFQAQTDTTSRVRLLNALYWATALDVESNLAALLEQVGQAALDAFDQFGSALFPVIDATDPTVVHVLAIYPSLFPDLQRYGHPVYDLVKAYRNAACDVLKNLRGTDCF